jgi:hypothetical protein
MLKKSAKKTKMGKIINSQNGVESLLQIILSFLKMRTTLLNISKKNMLAKLKVTKIKYRMTPSEVFHKMT